MGSIFSREGSKDYREGGEEKKFLDFVFAAYKSKNDNKDGNRLRIRSVEKKKEKKKGTVISISALFFVILARQVIWKVIERRERGKIERRERGKIEPFHKREEIGNGKDLTSTSTSTSTSFSSLYDELQLLILSKVPLRSLVKLGFVSKTWRSWICKEGYFIGKCPQRTDGVLVPRVYRFDYIPLPTNDDNYNEDEEESEEVDGHLCAAPIWLPSPTNCVFTFENASNGLLLISTVEREPEKIELLVHNPLTRQSLLLPKELRNLSYGPTWIGYEPWVSPHFSVVHASFCVPIRSDSLVMLLIFSSRSWTWRQEIVTGMRPMQYPRSLSGRAVTYGGRMFVDLTILCSVILVVDLRTTGKEYYFVVPLPPELPPRFETPGMVPRLAGAMSALGKCEGNIMYAYTQGGVLLVYKLLQGGGGGGGGGDYRWTLVVEDRSLRERLASKAGMTATAIFADPHDFLLHMPLLLISSFCSITLRCKLFSYNLMNGSLVQLYGYRHWIHKVTALSICPLEIYSGEEGAGKKEAVMPISSVENRRE